MEILLNLHKGIPLDKFHEELWFEFQNVPTQLFDYYLLRVAREMATKAPLVRRTVIIPMQPQVTRYYLDSPDELELDALLDLRHVPTGNIEQGSKKIPRFTGPPERLSCVSKAAWFEPKSNVLHVLLPCCGGTLRAVVSAKPKRDACELPEEFYDKYLTTLLMGTKAQILMITNRPWTNLRVGSELHSKYRSQVADLGMDELLNGQRGIVRMRHGPI